jgi:hypothetical protein
MTFAVLALALGSFCGWLSLPAAPGGGIDSARDLLDAYARVRPGETSVSDLASLGLDQGTSNVEMLSYLSVMERVVPHDSHGVDGLDDAVRDCISAQDRCSALVFAPAAEAAPTSSGILETIGLSEASAETGRPSEITLLVQGGRVIFKMLSHTPPLHEDTMPPSRVATAPRPLSEILRREE